MRRNAVRILTFLALSVGTTVPAAAQWLPPHIAEGLAQQLAGRFGALGEVTDPEGLLEGSRGILGAMLGTIDGWGVDGTLERAPEFDLFDWPSSGDRYLDAMGRFSVCNLLLLRQLQSPDTADDRNARLTSVLGLSSLTVAILRLREPFVAAGGDQGAIEAYLSGPKLEPIFDSIQSEQAQLTHAEERCRPLVVESVDGALRYMAAMNGPEE